MKKLVIFFVSLSILCSIAVGEEITFRGIPWGSNISYVEDAIEDGYFFYLPNMKLAKWEETIDLEDGLFSSFYRNLCGWEVTVVPKNDEKIAGYNATIELMFVYGYEDGKVLRDKESAELFSATYVFDVLGTQKAYDDIKSKLISLYGECEEYLDFPTLFHDRAEASVWYGAEDTALLLKHEISLNESVLPSSVFLTYQKTDYDAKIDILDLAITDEILMNEDLSRNDSLNGL